MNRLYMIGTPNGHLQKRASLGYNAWDLLTAVASRLEIVKYEVYM